jgi:quercetin dioxygenase-like cupin family protein
MNRPEFEAELERAGYEIRQGGVEPNEHREPHTHDFDVRFLVLEGSITLLLGNDRRAYGPGDTGDVPAGTAHEEHTGADGVRYLIGRRALSAPAR